VTINIHLAQRINFHFLSLLLDFWFNFVTWRQRSCLFTLRTTNEKSEGSECSCWSLTKVHVGSIPSYVGKEEKMKALWLLFCLCFITILTRKDAKYKY